MTSLIEIAIEKRLQLQFYYLEENGSGVRIVEPYQLGYNHLGHKVLSAWFLSGTSRSHPEETNWRQYLVSQMTGISVRTENFLTIRTGYKRAPNGLFRMVISEV